MPRQGDWCQMFTGRQFWPLDPRAEDIDPVDIIISLSRQCRFTGHTKYFYSVAQHSVLVARQLPEHLKLWGLLHDASEAYLVDVPRPLKKLPGFEAYREAEARVMACVCERFGIAVEQPREVTLADHRMLATEARDLMPDKPTAWNWMPEPYEQVIDPWPHHKAARVFSMALAHHGVDVVAQILRLP
jgi:uncharacterized protein